MQNTPHATTWKATGTPGLGTTTLYTSVIDGIISEKMKCQKVQLVLREADIAVNLTLFKGGGGLKYIMKTS